MFALSDARDYSFSKLPYLEREEETLYISAAKRLLSYSFLGLERL